MRWQVQGTDAVTGQPMTLGLDEPEAIQAVHSALSKKILVNRIRQVRSGGGHARMIAAVLVTVALSGLSVWLYEGRELAIHRADAAASAQMEIGRQLAVSQETVRTLAARGVMLESAQAGGLEGKKIVDELTIARDRIDALEAQLAAGQKQTESRPAKEATADAGVAALRGQLEESQQRAVRLDARIKELELQSQTQVATLQATNKDLAQQLDLLKSQLLLAAAKSTVVAEPGENAAPETPPVVAAGKWALATRFADVADYLNIHFDKDTIAYSPVEDGNVIGSGTWTSNAATIRVVMDHEKERVYSATLSVSLAADGPEKALKENVDLVGTFVRTFGPTIKNPNLWIASSVRNLAGKGANERLVLVGAECMITVWNAGGEGGIYNWRIEPSGNALGE